MGPSRCQNCSHPIREHAAECARCGSPRMSICHVRLNQPRAARPQSAPLSFKAKMAWVYVASLAAAVVLSACHEGIIPLTAGLMTRTLAASGSNFAIAFWFTLIPRTIGMAAAVAVLAIRTYLQWTGQVLLPLF